MMSTCATAERPMVEAAMAAPEDPIAQAQRHVREAEAHIARQSKLIEELERDGHTRMAEQARTVLNTIRHTLELARQHLRLEQKHHGTASSHEP